MSNCKTGECLAAWIDTEPCICDVPSGLPQELSAEKLAKANRLVSDIRDMDRALNQITKYKSFCRTLIWYVGNSGDSRLELNLPSDVAAGLIRTMRFHKMVALQETGIVSTGQGHRPVISK